MNHQNIHTTDTTESQGNLSEESLLNMASSYQSYKREQYKGTPFVVETDEEKGWRLGMGNHGVTDWDKDENKKKEVLKQIDKTNWQLLTVVISIICERIIEHKTFEMIKELEEKQNNK